MSKILWEEREDLYSLMLLRASIGDAAFESEKQNSPVNPALAEWPAEYFNWPGLYFTDWPPRLKIRVMSCDPSKGRDSRHGDFSAIVMGGKDERGVCYYDCDSERRSPEKICIDICKRVLGFGPDLLIIEGNQFQDLLKPMVERAAKEARVTLPEIKLVENDVNKLVRIRRMGPDFAQKIVRFKRNSPGIAELLQQAQDFPNGAHDDNIDALEMCRRFLVDAPKWEVR